MRVVALDVLLPTLLAVSGAMANTPPPSVCQVSAYRNLPRFVVSAILRKDSQDISIKLVHSVEFAANADTALGSFTRKVLDQYPGYSLLDTLVSREPTSCEAMSI